MQSILGKDEEAIDGYLYLTMYHLKTRNWVSLASVYNSISEIHLKNKNHGQAKEYLSMALNAMKDKKDSFNSGPSSFYEASIFYNASDVFYKEGEYKKAKIYARNAIRISIKNSYKLNLYKSAKILGEIYDKEKNVDSSLYYHKIHIDFRSCLKI